jgi:outer membrane protein assembly factor BamB
VHLALLLGAVLAPAGAHAQPEAEDPFGGLPEAPPESAPQPPAPLLTLRLLGEVPLPGPLPGGAPRWTGTRIEVPVAGGIASLAPETTAVAELRPAPGAPVPEDRWAVDARGQLRFGTSDEGFVVAEERCKRCERGWKRRWRLRVPGSVRARPLVHGRRVFFGALDNRIYAVKAKNGHRVWAVDVAGRMLEPLVLARGPSTAGEAGTDVILAVPDGGAELLALDPATGIRLARHSLEPDQGQLVGVPLNLPDGRVAVARQEYTETEAALMLYEITGPEAAAVPGPGAALNR